MKIIEDMRVVITGSAELYQQKRKVQREPLLHNEQLKNGIERVVLLRNRIRSRANARKRNKVRITTLASVRQTLERASQMNAKNIRNVFNVALYLLQMDQDL